MDTSVAMCTYNGGRHLQQQLDSIQAQTRPPRELIVCDDGSTDDTAELVEQFAATVSFPVRFVRNTMNLGSTKNFEQAVQLCRGEAIALCDQDDIWAPDKLARMVDVLEREPQVAGVFSNADLIDDEGRPVPGDLWQRVGFTPGRQRRFDRATAPFQLIHSDTVTGATMVFRAAWLPKLVPFPSPWVHDGWIALLLAGMAELRALPVCTMSYRIHAAQQVGTTQFAWREHLATPAEKARRFHRANADRVQQILTRMEELAPSGARPAVLAELRRKLRFLRGRIALLDQPPLGRIYPALTLLPAYVRYERGVFSLLRDLAHRAKEAEISTIPS